MISLLKRESVVIPEPFDFCDVEFRNDVSSKLGYKELVKEANVITNNMPLLKALKETGIRPFTSESVEKYKKRVLNRFAKFDKICFSVAILGCLILIAAIVIRINDDDGSFLAGNMAMIGCMSLVVSIGIWFMFTKFQSGEWNLIVLSDYPGRVPEFALKTALDIKAKCPTAQFWIDEYVISQKSADPFLVVSSDVNKPFVVLNTVGPITDRFYLEVWNEPGFVQEREI